MRTRGEAASAASRVIGLAPGRCPVGRGPAAPCPGACRRRARAAGSRRAAAALRLLLGLLLLLHLRQAEIESAIRSGPAPRARWRGAYSSGRSSGSSQPPQRALEILGDLLERQRQRGAPSDQHIVMAGRQDQSRPMSLTISLRRRRTRLRSTAVPTFLDTVKPTRTGPPSARLRACNTNAAVGTLTPVAAARKSRPLPQPLHGDDAGRGAAGVRH